MTLTELKKEVADWAKEHGYKDWRFFIFCGTSFGDDTKDEYQITVTHQKKSKEYPASLEAKGNDPEWCLRFIQSQWDALTEEQESPDIKLT